jgi:branched-chain amino acid transport system substrate-binding protein
MPSLRSAGIALALAGVLSACTLLVTHGEVQCKIDADCQAKGFPAAAKCSAENVCTGPGAGGCVSNADCPDVAGGPQICRKSDAACVPVVTAECPRILGKGAASLKNDDAIVLGSIFSLKGVNQASGTARTNSVELAATDFEETVVGLPGGTGGKPRPLVFVACDDSSDNGVANKAAAHLVTDLRVPAIIGPGGSGIVTSVAQTTTIPGGVFLITPSATSTSLSGFDPLVWRTAPSDVLQAEAIKDQIAAMEVKFKADNPSVTKVKVEVVYQNNTYGQGLLTAMSNGLTINGALVTDTANAGLFKGIAYDATTLDPAAAVAQVITDKPNLLVLVGTAEVITKFLTPVEASWPGATPRPLYLLSDAARKTDALDAVKGNDPLRLRVRGTVPGTANALFNSFKLRYAGKFGGDTSVFGMAGAYDSVYLLAYAIVSLGASPVTGKAIAAAMPKMVGGTKTDLVPDGIKAAFQTLANASGKLDVNGASGPLDFDPAQHEAQSDIVVFCISKDGGGNPVFSETGRFYDASAKKMAGTFACP